MVVEERFSLRNRIIGVLLQDAREKANRSKRECADALGVSTRTITSYEMGRKPISLPELEVLAYLFDVPVSHFWEEDPELVPGDRLDEIDNVLDLRHRIVGALLRQARQERDVSQSELGELVDSSASRIASLEYGERPLPLVELEAMADYLDVPLDYFLDEQQGPIGRWHEQESLWEGFSELSEDEQQFVVNPANRRYLHIAMRLAQMPADGLRMLGSGLLDLTQEGEG